MVAAWLAGQAACMRTALRYAQITFYTRAAQAEDRPLAGRRRACVMHCHGSDRVWARIAERRRPALYVYLQPCITMRCMAVVRWRAAESWYSCTSTYYCSRSSSYYSCTGYLA